MGAGFSKKAGLPLVRDFTLRKTIERLRKNLKKKSEIQRLNKVTHYFQDRIKQRYCDNNIESVLNHVSVANYLYMESQTEGRITYPSSDIFNDLLWYLVRVLEIKEKQKIPNEYHEFLRNVFKNRATIISFNYDLVLEKALRDLALTCDYGLTDKPGKNSVVVLKVHGSVNWAKCFNCQNYIFYSDYAASRILNGAEKCSECNKKELNPIIIPPILYKDTFYKNSEFEDIVRMIWSKSNEVLSKAKNIVFIGFSMAGTDAYAQELFKFSSNMNANPDLSCIVITRPKNKDDMKKLRRQYRSVLVGNQIQFNQIDFSDYMS